MISPEGNRIDIRPGDTILLTTQRDMSLTPSVIDDIRRRLRTSLKLPDDFPILVLDGMSLQVISEYES